MIKHKILCDDCLHYFKNASSNTIDLIFADSPYNKGRDYEGYFNDNTDNDKYFSWCRDWISECFRILKPTGSIYIMNSSDNLNGIMNIMNTYGIYQNMIIWKKHMYPPEQKYRYSNGYRGILFYTNTNDYYYKRNKYTNVWSDIAELVGGYLAQKEVVLKPNTKQMKLPFQLPLKLLRRVIEISSLKEEVILDPFSGMGGISVACEEMERSSISIEINPNLCIDSYDRLLSKVRQSKLSRNQSIIEKINF